MAWANKGGRSWARIMATVFFVVLTAGGLTSLIFTRDFTSVLVLYMIFLVYWLAGLSAVVLLWRPSSSDYYTAVSNRSKATREASRSRMINPQHGKLQTPVQTETGFPGHILYGHTRRAAECRVMRASADGSLVSRYCADRRGASVDVFLEPRPVVSRWLVPDAEFLKPDDLDQAEPVGVRA